MKNVNVHRRALTALSLLSFFVTTVATSAPNASDLRKLLDPDLSDPSSKFTAVGSVTKNSGCALSASQMKSVAKGVLQETGCLTSKEDAQREQLINTIGEFDSNPSTSPPSCISTMLQKCRENHDVYSEKIRAAAPGATTHTVFGFSRPNGGTTYFACRTFVTSTYDGKTKPSDDDLNYFGSKYGRNYIANDERITLERLNEGLNAVNAKCEVPSLNTSEYDRFLTKVAKSQDEAIRADSIQKATKQKADSIKNEVRKNISSPAQPAK